MTAAISEVERLQNILKGVGCPHGRDPEGVCLPCEQAQIKIDFEAASPIHLGCGKPEDQHGCDFHSYCCPGVEGYHTFESWSTIGRGDPLD